jgi:uncharacterized protein YegP (UPF0339 family)
MAKKLKAPRIEFWRNKQKVFNYRLIGINGRVLMQNNQGYQRKASLIKNLKAVGKFFGTKHDLIEVAK